MNKPVPGKDNLGNKMPLKTRMGIKTKELPAPIASMVLRYRDCIKCQPDKCHELPVPTEQVC